MTKITELRKHEYDEALSHANSGRVQDALDSLWILRLRVDLSIYRRALVNLTIAAILPEDDRRRYALECLDLLDLLRQQQKSLEHTKLPGTQPDNGPILVSNSISSLEHEHGNQEEIEHIADLEDTAREILSSAGGTISELSEDVDHLTDADAAVYWGISNAYRAVGDVPNNLPTIDGFLRDDFYAPFVQNSTTETGTYQDSVHREPLKVHERSSSPESMSSNVMSQSSANSKSVSSKSLRSDKTD